MYIKTDVFYYLAILTNYFQIDKITQNGLCTNLTLIHSGIAFLGPLDLQNPVVGFRVMIRLKALIAGVCVTSNGQDVNVPVTNPRYL